MADHELQKKVASFPVPVPPGGRTWVITWVRIKNYVALQDDYECVYCIVDLHALTTVEDTLNLRQNTYDMALDLLGSRNPTAGNHHVRPIAGATGDRTAYHTVHGHSTWVS